MRRVLTILTAIVLLIVSMGIGVFTADLPFWQRALQLPLPVGEVYLPTAPSARRDRAFLNRGRRAGAGSRGLRPRWSRPRAGRVAPDRAPC